MEKKGLISCRIAKSPLGPKRKYYTITKLGEKYYQDFKIIFNEIISKTNGIINDESL